MKFSQQHQIKLTINFLASFKINIMKNSIIQLYCAQCIQSHYTYQEVAKWELICKDHKFARHIPNLFFKANKILIQVVQTTSWIWVYKGQLHGCEFNDEQVASKPFI